MNRPLAYYREVHRQLRMDPRVYEKYSSDKLAAIYRIDVCTLRRYRRELRQEHKGA